MPVNPWAMTRTDDPTSVPATPVQQTNAYAVPSLSAGDAYQTEFGWAPNLAQRTSSVETPSAQRLGTIPLYERDTQGSIFAPDSYYSRLNNDIVERTKDARESTDAVGWSTRSGVVQGERRWAPNPREIPPPEPRVTSRLGQNTWSFTRFFDQLNRTYAGDPPTGSARTFNGMHFSMADHRRKYDILGMAPVRSRRNTYRVEPTPWDVGIVDLPAESTQTIPEQRIMSVDLPRPSRNYRLGG